MKFISLILSLFSILLLTSCGHNVATHSKGWGIDISWNQDSMVPNLRLGYWDVSYAMVKENVELTMKSNAGLSANAGNSTSNSSGTDNKTTGSSLSSNAGGTASNEIEIKTGPQINGYVKEVLTNPNLKKETVEAIKAITGKETNSNKNSKK